MKNRYVVIKYNSYGNVIYEDYSKLEEMLENSLIALHLQYRTKNDAITGEKIKYPYITMKYLNDKHLNDLELEYTFKYLEKKGIVVSGTTEIYSGIYDNYECVGVHGNRKSMPSLSNEENYNLLCEFEKTHDTKLREKLILGNMKLVEYISSNYSLIYGVDINEVESYGYEGLINAIDSFESSKCSKVSAYFSLYIDTKICNGFRKQLYSQGIGFYGAIKKAMEIIYEDYPELTYEEPMFIKKVTDELNSYCKNKMYLYTEEKVKYMINHFLSVSLELVDEEIVDLEDTRDYANEAMLAADKSTIESLIDNVQKTSKRNKDIAKLYFGFTANNKPVSVFEISRMYGLNKQSVYQIIKKILEKIRKMTNIEGLQSYLNEPNISGSRSEEIRLRTKK